ncbi:MAG: PilZ domain-containing protein [Silvanigrellaceae bacterium]|nr:PilZ domain-containing protein [Silvanigrellaceae bacterium]
MTDTIENRRDTRRSVFIGEGIKIYIKDEDEARSIHGEITDISPWGSNIYIIDQKLSTYPKKGDTVKIYYETRNKKNSFCRGRVVYILENTIEEIKYLRYGIEFINDNNPKSDIKNYEIPDIFSPHCWCEDPFFFHEKLIFKIKSIHSTGMILMTSARNKTLIPNLELQLKVSIPAGDEFFVNVKIEQTINSNKPSEKDKYYVHVKFEKTNSKFLQVMVEYILFCGVEVTPKELRENNLPVDIIENSLSYYYALDKFDMEKVIQLRKIGLFESIKINNENNDEIYKDKYDNYSRQVLCKVGKKPVACIRIIYNLRDKNKTEMNQFVNEVPEWLWSKKFVEISKFAWDKDYRESDVFINMIRQIVRIVIESGHTHIIANAPEPLKPLYTKVGFIALNYQWKEEFEESKAKESLLILDAKGILTGEVLIEKFIWNKIYSRVSHYLGLANTET